MIGHTQPRRIAARTVAERIAEELGTDAGRDRRLPGALHRPGRRRHAGQADDRRHPARRDPARPDAARATTRSSSTRPTSAASTSTSSSATCRQLLPRRPDLKVIITSATIDPERFCRALRRRRAGHRGVRPHLPGRGALPAAGRATDERRAAGGPRPGRRRSATPSTSCGAEGHGDMLVFLSGEREIRDTADALRRRRTCRDTEIAAAVRPAVGRRAAPGVRTRHTGRRVVLATNVAETSLTVPGIRYVVDPGTARISRYSQAAQGAAAADRAGLAGVAPTSAPGRCGRVADGICIRLYAEEDFDGPAGVHRAGDPAHQPGVGHPADDRARPGRRRRVPVRRPAGPAQRPRRRAAARGARRAGRTSGQAAHADSAASSRSCPSTRGWPGWSSRPTATAASARCWSSPPRCRSRTRASARPTSSRQADEKHARFADPDVRLPRLPQPVELPARAAAASCPATSSAGCAARVPQLPARPRVAGPHGQLRQVARTLGHHGRRTARSSRPADAVHTVAAGRAAVAHRPARTATKPRVPRRPRRPVRDLPRLGAGPRSRRAG